MSKLCVIFEEIRRTGGCGRHRGPAPAESAFPVYRSGGPCRGRRARAVRNRRSNGDRVRIGFKISKIHQHAIQAGFRRVIPVHGVIPRPGSRRWSVPRAVPTRGADPPATAVDAGSTARADCLSDAPPEFGYVVPAGADGARSIPTLANFLPSPIRCSIILLSAEGTDGRVRSSPVIDPVGFSPGRSPRMR